MIGIRSGSPYVAAVEENTRRPTPAAAHRVEQVPRADHVVVPVALGALDRLGDERERGEVHDGVDPGRQGRAERARVQQRDGDVLGARWDGLGVPAREVVEHDDLVAGGEQLRGDDRADVARAPRDEDPHARAS